MGQGRTLRNQMTLVRRRTTSGRKGEPFRHILSEERFGNKLQSLHATKGYRTRTLSRHAQERARRVETAAMEQGKPLAFIGRWLRKMKLI